MKRETAADAARIALGFRVKTGRAIAMVLRGPADSPAFVRRDEMSLVDPKMASTYQPFHAVMELPWPDALKAAEKSAQAIRKIADAALAVWLREILANGYVIAGAGVVGGSPNDAAKIGNPHVRAHAAEGQLFPRMLAAAAQDNRVDTRCFPDRKFEEHAITQLRLSPVLVRQRLAAIGDAAGRPWRSDEKMAALAAWLILARR